MVSRNYILPDKTDKTVASDFCRRLRENVELAQSLMKEGEQIVIFWYLPNGEVITVDSLGHSDPNMLEIFGTDSEGRRSGVFVHLYAAQLVLKKIKLEPQKQHRPIGFRNSAWQETAGDDNG